MFTHAENRTPLVRFRIIQTTSFCKSNDPFRTPNTSSTSGSVDRGLVHRNEKSPSGNPVLSSPFKRVTWIGVATLTSKILGLLREIVMASVFGIGPVATAFKYASVLPGFATSLVGGVNGPIHITMATTLSKLPEERQRKLFQHTSCILFLVGGILGVLVFVYAELIIHIYAPGLWISTEGWTTREMAINQLRLMTPCIVFGGPTGLGYGYLSAKGNNVVPAVSPAFSSLLLILSCVACTLLGQSNSLVSNGVLVCFGASVGIILQWIIQVLLLGPWCSIVPDSWIAIPKHGDVYGFFALLLPATVSSGLLHIASYTDLYFASLVPGAIAGLSYAYLLVMAPLGLLSSMILLPLLPTFARLSKTELWPNLAEYLKRAMLLCLVVLVPIMSTMCILAEPLIYVLFERHAFSSSASTLVSSLFLFYSLGSPFIIVRELLVAVFYALGDGRGPLLVSLGAIALNAILDWVLVSHNFGAQGLALSTSFTTSVSVIVLFHLLKNKLAGALDFTSLICPLLLLSFCFIISSVTTIISYRTASKILSSMSIARFYKMKEMLSLSAAGFLGIVGFFLPVVPLIILGYKPARDIYVMLLNQQVV